MLGDQLQTKPQFSWKQWRIVDDIMLAIEDAGERHVGLGSDLFSRERAP